MTEVNEFTIEAGLKALSERWPEIRSHSTDSPIFLLSAGWRSGSTLLQRLVTSSERILVWGEPYSHADIIHLMGLQFRAFTPTLGEYPYPYPRDDQFIESILAKNTNGQEVATFLKNQHIANLYPSVVDLIEAHLKYFDTLFAKPAKKLGLSRWGIKYVTVTMDDAIYLKWLFPKAKFIFVYRNPYMAYVSYRGHLALKNQPLFWWRSWPFQPIKSATDFGVVWKELLEGYLLDYQKVEGCLISYENLNSSSETYEQLVSYLDIPLDKSVLDKKIKSTSDHIVLEQELKELAQVVEPLASQLGYKALKPLLKVIDP